MPQIIVSVATASQIFIKRAQSANPVIPGPEIERITIAGGAGLSKRQVVDAVTGKRLHTREEIDFATTVVSDEQYEWLKDEHSFSSMVQKGWLRALPISEREVEKMKPHHIEAEVEHLLPVMKKASDNRDRQKTEADFANAGKKFATGGAV